MKKTKLLKAKKLFAQKKHYILAVGVIATVSIAGGYKVFVSRAATISFLDISSPQCGTERAIGGSRTFGIVGLNGTYMAFGTNRCLMEQVKLFRGYDLYVGANYPSRHCPTGTTAYNCGILAAKYNTDVIKFSRLNPGKLWIDVESGPGIPWSPNKSENAAYLVGMATGLKNTLHKPVGYYSTENMWNNITGGMRSSGPNWYASGQFDATSARRYCTKRFGGILPMYVQYVDRSRNLDVNVSC